MAEVTLTGFLICQNEDEAECVERLLPPHRVLTLAEPGCLTFAVARTNNPLVWAVEERFFDRAAFNSHQARVADSEWGRSTMSIERRYTVAETA